MAVPLKKRERSRYQAERGSLNLLQASLQWGHGQLRLRSLESRASNRNLLAQLRLPALSEVFVYISVPGSHSLVSSRTQVAFFSPHRPGEMKGKSAKCQTTSRCVNSRSVQEELPCTPRAPERESQTSFRQGLEAGRWTNCSHPGHRYDSIRPLCSSVGNKMPPSPLRRAWKGRWGGVTAHGEHPGSLSCGTARPF